MKCDELCVYKDCEDFQTFDRHFTEAYKKSEVDAAIAELKRENERLKKKMDDYHLMSDIRRSKIKELKRALWLAKAETNTLMSNEKEVSNHILYMQSIGKHSMYEKMEDKYLEWTAKWQHAAFVCRQKAEEYK